MATPVPDGKRFTHVYERGEPVGSRVELLGVVSAARLECSEPAAETGELVRRQRLSCGAVWHGCLG